ncbi:MAG: c-type cytochrome [Anaeromyxobacter sp.]|nr:c-type cytochrome [Anaeromyxobacter sp.]MBL0277442.1 c-type cytochrome [Anaeromyxobacter sp.]
MSRRAALALLALAGCAYYEVPRFDAPQRLGGVLVPAETLNRGARAYMTSCRPCHGHLGDGKGPQAVGMAPPPRDLRLGIVSFASVPAGSLWRDEDLVRTVRHGLAGTGMRPWSDVSDQDLEDIVAFVKTLAPRFRTEAPEPAVARSADPWTGRRAEGARRGRAVYHGVARCQACHPAYATPAEIAAFAHAAGVLAEPRPDASQPLSVASDFGRLLRATDFREGPLRAVRPGQEPADLYRAIAAGLGGTAMPTWKGVLPEEDLWALVHYVDALARGEAAR